MSKQIQRSFQVS